MKRWMMVSFLALAIAGCKGGEVEPPARAQVKLTRRPGDRIAVELISAPVSARALELVLVVEGSASFAFDEARAPDGLPLDTVRIAQAGTNRAILFAGDKRGIGLPTVGDVATFSLIGDGEGQLRIERVLLADSAGKTVPVDAATTLAVR